MKKFCSILTLIVLMLFFQDQICAQRKNQVRKVVIDAGHGGYDSGAKGRNSREKDIALSIALKTGKLIQKNCPGVEVIYTRETDVFVELYRRAQIANINKADLFISIHCNANPSPLAFGTETYVMGLHKSVANLSVARAENASILLEDNYSKRYDGFNPNSPEASIIFSLFQNAYLDKSLKFASKVEKSFTENTKLPERGVKQAGFLVLYKTTMPGVLIETGFLSNANEEAFLNSTAGQDRLAFSIYRAFDDFRKAAEGNNTRASTDEDTVIKPQPAMIRSQQEKLEQALKGDTFGYRDNHETVTDDQSLADLKKNKIRNLKTDTKSSDSRSSNGELTFRVQFRVSKRAIPLDGKDFKDIPNPKKYFLNGEYKYTAGDELTSRDAEKIRQFLAGKGYRDAFVLPFLNDNRISMKEAQEMIKNKQ